MGINEILGTLQITDKVLSQKVLVCRITTTLSGLGTNLEKFCLFAVPVLSLKLGV
jgi:hypothetical protein